MASLVRIWPVYAKAVANVSSTELDNFIIKNTWPYSRVRLKTFRVMRLYGHHFSVPANHLRKHQLIRLNIDAAYHKWRDPAVSSFHDECDI